jgi:hypothetical protein
LRGAVLLFSFAALVPLAGCSSTSGKFDEPKAVSLEALIPSVIRVRRPSGPGADPAMGPGGPDYVSQPDFPDSRLDCRTLEELLPDARLEPMMECLKSLPGPLHVRYALERGAVPELKLLPPDEWVGDQPAAEPPKEEKPASDSTPVASPPPPDCLAKEWGSLPVPREVFYAAEVPRKHAGWGEERVNECFATRLNVEAGRILGAKVGGKWQLGVTLPPDPPVKDVAELRRVISGWILTPIFRPEGNEAGVSGKLVPRALCSECFGGDLHLPAAEPGEHGLDRKAPVPPQWP